MGALGALRLVVTGAVLSSCSTMGSHWVNEPLGGSADSDDDPRKVEPPGEAEGRKPPKRFDTQVIGGEAPAQRPGEPSLASEPIQGRILGTFRNTYYDFPAEGEFQGEPVALHSPRCEVIHHVPRGFYEAVCVQGSGLLADGRPVSFAKRDCACAEICPRTSQRICFDALDARSFPWGRGALGKPITPLLTIAVDDTVIPMKTPVYIPEYDGLPRDPSETSRHDGCFIAQDRGLKVKGKHVDVFTGDSSITLLWNRLVPSNQGVTVVLDNPKCLRAQ